MRHLIAWTAAFALAICLSACGGDATSGEPEASPSPGPPIDDIVLGPNDMALLGISAALTGNQINLGTDIADAAELAVDDYGSIVAGRIVRVQRMDDECTNAEKAVEVAEELIKDASLIGVIGPMCTTGAQAAADEYERAGVIHMSPSATRTDLSAAGERFFFRTAWRDDAQARLQAAYAFQRLAARTAVLVDDGDPYGRGLADAFVGAFEEQGGSIVARERVVRGAVDFASLARQVIAANPDVVVFQGLNPEGALFVRALRDAGYAKAFMAPDGLLSVRDFIETAGPAAEGAIITGGPAPDDLFRLRFVTKANRPPSTPFVLQSHDAVTMLLRAVDAVARNEGQTVVIEREALMEALRSMSYAGLTGDIAFDEQGDRVGETAAEVGLRIYEVRQGAFIPVDQPVP